MRNNFFMPGRGAREKLLGNIQVNLNYPEPRQKIAEIDFSRQIILSPFAHFFKIDKNLNVLYNSLNLKKVYGQIELMNFFNLLKGKSLSGFEIINYLNGRAGESELKNLFDNGFICHKELTPEIILKQYQEDFLLNRPTFSHLYIIPTYKCNLGCLYCVNALVRNSRCWGVKSFDENLFINEDTIKRGLDLFITCLKNNTRPHVVFHGGEPLINWDMITFAVNYIRQLENTVNKKFRITLITNGLLLNRNKVEILKNNNVEVVLSLDGLKKHHDKMRVHKDGKGTWEEVINAYKLLIDSFNQIAVSCTVGPHNYNDLEEIAEYFAAGLDIRLLSFSYMQGAKLNNAVRVSPVKATQKMLKAFEIFRRYGVNEDLMMRKLTYFIEERPRFHECTAFGHQITIGPDGGLGPCHGLVENSKNFWGNVRDKNATEKVLGGRVSKRFAGRSPYKDIKCFNCEALGICGGGCILENLACGGTIDELEADFCAHTKTTLKWMLEDLGAIITRDGFFKEADYEK